MAENNGKFTYTYTAPTETERREINDIRRRYMPKTEYETKLEQLKQADAKLRRVPTVTGVVLGVAGTLMFGWGMACVLEWKLILAGHSSLWRER